MIKESARPEPDELPGSPVALPDGEAASAHALYTSMLAAGSLVFQACGACTAAVFPPRQRCNHCGADALSWRRSAGTGTVYSTTTIQPRDQAAYSVVLVDLDEGYRMMSRIAPGTAEGVAIGDRVEVRIQDHADQVLPMFVPTGGAL